MKIVWAPNPLRTVVMLDDADMLLFRERLKVEALQECIVSASLDLDPKWAPIGKPWTQDEAIAEARAVLNLAYLLDDEPRRGKTFSQDLDERVTHYVAELLAEHCGDCICVACSCSKCQAETLMGIDTIKGLGKHEAYKIRGAFKTEGGEVSIRQAVERLTNYEPTWRPDQGWKSEADFQQHVSRWTEEGRRAHAWLEAYRLEHFSERPSEPRTAFGHAMNADPRQHTEFRKYRRSQIAELREWQVGETLTGVSISPEDAKAGSPKLGDMIARNPKNHADQWLVAAQYFRDNFESM